MWTLLSLFLLKNIMFGVLLYVYFKSDWNKVLWINWMNEWYRYFKKSFTKLQNTSTDLTLLFLRI